MPMGGAQAIGAFLDRYGPHGLDVRLAGLVDAGEEAVFGRALERAGLGAVSRGPTWSGSASTSASRISRTSLIRAAGVDTVEEVIEAEGGARVLPDVPAAAGVARSSLDEQLRRFVKTHSGRNIRTAGLLADALDLARVPRPLGGLLAHV